MGHEHVLKPDVVAHGLDIAELGQKRRQPFVLPRRLIVLDVDESETVAVPGERLDDGALVALDVQREVVERAWQIVVVR